MPQSLQVALKNNSDSSEIYAYITGLAIQHNGQRCLLKANGRDLYFPQSPSAPLSPLLEDCAIPLGPPGKTVSVTIPEIAGGRMWFSVNEKLTFLLAPGPALVEPSVLNPSDPNAGVNFGFCEFTLNDVQLYANISYVDFVPRIPIAITLQQASGNTQSVAGMPPDGLDKIADGLIAQAQKDGRPWDKLIVQKDGRNLRILNATHGDAVGASFDGYYEPYVKDVWRKFSQGSTLKINTQAGPGVVQGQVDRSGQLVIGGEAFQKPNTADILGCNSGPFTTGPSATRNAIIPRLAAAFVRSALLVSDEHPSDPSTFYAQDPTNHYARMVHNSNLDRKGYAFAYDDVQPDGGQDQSGKVNAGDPVLFTVSIGGRSTAAAQMPTPPDMAGAFSVDTAAAITEIAPALGSAIATVDSGIVSENMDKEVRSAWIQSILWKVCDKFPGKNVVIVWPAHDASGLQGCHRGDLYCHCPAQNIDMKYSCYVFNSGVFSLKGNGGYSNWAFAGHFNRHGNVVSFTQ